MILRPGRSHYAMVQEIKPRSMSARANRPPSRGWEQPPFHVFSQVVSCFGCSADWWSCRWWSVHGPDTHGEQRPRSAPWLETTPSRPRWACKSRTIVAGRPRRWGRRGRAIGRRLEAWATAGEAADTRALATGRGAAGGGRRAAAAARKRAAERERRAIAASASGCGVGIADGTGACCELYPPD